MKIDRTHLNDHTGKVSNTRVMCNRASWSALLFALLSFGLLYLDKNDAATQGFIYALAVLGIAHGFKKASQGKEVEKSKKEEKQP